MLPPIDPDAGVLPVGEHHATWDQVIERFGWNAKRRALLDGPAEALELLRAVGSQQVWLNGSFVTAKDEPSDLDACWDTTGVDLEAIDPVFLDLSERTVSAEAPVRGQALPERHRGGQRPRVKLKGPT